MRRRWNFMFVVACVALAAACQPEDEGSPPRSVIPGQDAGGADTSGDATTGGDASPSDDTGPTPAGNPLTAVTSLDVGGSTACAVSNGDVYCWGATKPDGESRLSATRIDGLDSPVSEIYVSSRWICALHTSGDVSCWGDNRYGQLGDGTTDNRGTPALVDGLAAPVTKLSMTDFTTCALLDTGDIQCWGANNDGEIGDGTTTDRATPTLVTESSGEAVDLTSTAGGSCAATADGGLECWGANEAGQAGDGTTTDRLTAAPVQNLPSDVAQMPEPEGFAASPFRCVVLDDGQIGCWGNNDYTQLGEDPADQLRANIFTYPPASGGAGEVGATRVELGSRHACALLEDGSVGCWGYDTAGQTGSGQSTLVDGRYRVEGLDGDGAFVDLTVRDDSACVVYDSGEVYCWGDGVFSSPARSAQRVDNLPNAVDAKLGMSACALLDNSQVACWGNNSSGQVGYGVDMDSFASARIVVVGE